MSNWLELKRELDNWQDLGRVAEFWWRDDDAEQVTERLVRLNRIGRAHKVSPALAVSPALMNTTLLEVTVGDSPCTILQHGFAHTNHAPSGEKKCELGSDRPIEQVIEELSIGLARMQHVFKDAFLPVMVPPWNRISKNALSRLSEIGFKGVSTYLARRTAADHNLVRYNTHVDIIDWKCRQFAGLESVLDLTVSHLADKRAGKCDPEESTGLLTHHLQHDDDCWEFIDQFLAFTRQHPAAKWMSPQELF